MQVTKTQNQPILFTGLLKWMVYVVDISMDESENVLTAIEHKKQIEPFHIHPQNVVKKES